MNNQDQINVPSIEFPSIEFPSIQVPSIQVPSDLLKLVWSYGIGHRTPDLCNAILVGFSNFFVQQGYMAPDYIGNNDPDVDGHIMKYIIDCPSDNQGGARHTLYINLFPNGNQCGHGIRVVCSGPCFVHTLGPFSIYDLFESFDGFGLRDELVKPVVDG